MNTVALLGDTHGSMTSPFSIVRAMGDSEYGIVAGDFGYWPRAGWWDAWINELADRLESSGKRLWFVDGNHEDFKMLSTLSAISDKDEFGAIPVHAGCSVGWFQRGTRWTWGGTTFLAMGGAPSIDKDYRLAQEKRKGEPRTLWFPEEEITLSDIEAAGDEPVDVLITHDGPRNIPMRLFPFGDMSRTMLSELAIKVKPKHWVHGHYHRFMAYNFPEYNEHTMVWGLDESHGRDWYATLDLNTGLVSI